MPVDIFGNIVDQIIADTPNDMDFDEIKTFS